MSKNLVLIIVIIMLFLIIVGIGVGIFLFTNNSGERKVKPLKTYNITLDDLYCNIKDSKRILKIKITLETTNEKTYEDLTDKHFLIRDEVNKIIRNLTEEELEGKEGQTNLQEKIKTNLIDLFQDESITNVYFNDFIIQ